ncbi:hypothetical protein Q9L42_019415 [Methylomarinum sp. Ch1-1]|uniref:Small metal-binding protein n=1 Tax=Methylomarinum roseum TaxID=3067653 RepID=A0AAU7NU47_9GAMM|nr:hypothetical protein [Methylomarinum sp. Ch1-1]MDP4519436.1 hypothetical protein [Methylomarinum sp. Ch1-1]
MNIIKNTALMLSLAFSLGSFSSIAYAEDAAKGSVHSPNQAIMHLEKAKVEIMHKDFVPPSEHLKAARAESEKVTGKPSVVKEAAASIIQAQIKVKEGDLKGATEEMNKTLELYKSLQEE